MTVRRLASNPQNVHKAKPIFSFLHEYESRYGDLTQMISLENRMRELFPENPTLEQFSHRYSTPFFNPTAVRPILSSSQTRPKGSYPKEIPEPRHGTPVPKYMDAPPASDSPKRPAEEFDDDTSRPRKFVRAESPLRVVQSRRMEQQKRTQVNGSQSGSQFRHQGSPAPLPRDVVYLLSVIPPASTYNAGRFSADRLVDLMRRIEIPGSVSQIPLPQPMHGLGASQPPILGVPPFGGKENQ